MGSFSSGFLPNSKYRHFRQLTQYFITIYLRLFQNKMFYNKRISCVGACLQASAYQPIKLKKGKEKRSNLTPAS